MATTESLLTAEEFLQLPGDGQPRELVQGHIVMMNMPGFRHGEVCARIAGLLSAYRLENDCGRIVTNDSGVITARSPDSVRGADGAFYSYRRLPKSERPRGYPEVAPDLVFEVRSPSDSWPEMLTKVGEYLAAGVTAVCVLDPDSETINVHHVDGPTEELQGDDELRLSNRLPGFSVAAKAFFE